MNALIIRLIAVAKSAGLAQLADGPGQTLVNTFSMSVTSTSSSARRNAFRPKLRANNVAQVASVSPAPHAASAVARGATCVAITPAV